MKALILEFFRQLEKLASKAQGKGYGTASITREIHLARTLLGDSPIRVCIDVGGNVGNYTAGLRTAFPKADIHTFEPASVNVERLKTRFADDDHVLINAVAVSEHVGEGVLWSDQPGSGLASLGKRRLDHLGIGFEQQEAVRTIRFEDYWTNQLDRAEIDLLKLDVEGYELAALVGCGAALDHVRVIQFEFGGCNVDTRTYLRDFWHFFRERGFDLHRITPFGLQKMKDYKDRDEVFTTTNFLALRS